MDSVRRALVGNFVQHLTPEMAAISECSDPIVSTGGVIPRLMEALCLAFSAHAASRGYSIAAEEKIKEAESTASSARSSKRRAEKKRADAEQKVADLEKQLQDAGAHLTGAVNARERSEARLHEEEAARRAAEDALSAAQREHTRFMQEELPQQLEQARRMGWEDYKKSDEFEARIAAEYRTGFQDMKAGFRLTNPHIAGVDWSFAPEESEGTEYGEAETPMVEEGEVVGDEMDLENIILLDEPERPDETEQPAPAEQPDDQPPLE